MLTYIAVMGLLLLGMVGTRWLDKQQSAHLGAGTPFSS